MIKPGLFIISALKVKAPGELETVYYAEDYASGGYPYWTTEFGKAATFSEKPDVAKRIKTCMYMYERVTMIKVYSVQLNEV